MPAGTSTKPAAAAAGGGDSGPQAAETKSRTGRWEALTNLSIGRRYDKEKLADIVHKGEIVTLADDVAQRFLHGHRVPVIRPAAEQNTPAPAIRAKDLFGQQPSAAQFGARPDPAGASTVTVNPADPATHPEANDPQTSLDVNPDAAKDK